jgi:hypothetical protein
MNEYQLPVYANDESLLNNNMYRLTINKITGAF